MKSEITIGRWAGTLYLIMIVTGMFSLMAVPARLNVANDVHATLANIIAHESLFRLGIAGFIVDQLAWLALALVLFRLLRSTQQSLAITMIAFVLTSVPIGLVGAANRLDALSILTAPTVGHAFTPEHLEALAKISLAAYGNDLLVATIFWGLWLLPFGYLIMKSRLVPAFLGVLLIVGGFAYLFNFFGELLVPHYSDSAFSAYVLLPASIGEIATCLWLVMFGSGRPVINQLKNDVAPHSQESRAT